MNFVKIYLWKKILLFSLIKGRIFIHASDQNYLFNILFTTFIINLKSYNNIIFTILNFPQQLFVRI